MGTLGDTITFAIAVLLVFLPLPFLFRAKNRNIALLSLAIWIVQRNIFQGINAVLWSDNVVIKWAVYCDISEYISVLLYLLSLLTQIAQIALFLKDAGVFGMVASNMCILRHLEHISSPAYVGADPNYARKRTIFEILMCIVFPFVFAAARKHPIASYSLYFGECFTD